MQTSKEKHSLMRKLADIGIGGNGVVIRKRTRLLEKKNETKILYVALLLVLLHFHVLNIPSAVSQPPSQDLPHYLDTMEVTLQAHKQWGMHVPSQPTDVHMFQVEAILMAIYPITLYYVAYIYVVTLLSFGIDTTFHLAA